MPTTVLPMMTAYEGACGPRDDSESAPAATDGDRRSAVASGDGAPRA